MRISSLKENIAKVIFIALATFSIISVFAIIFYIFYASFPAFQQIGVFNFLFGTTWAPQITITDPNADVTKIFGIFQMILSSLCVTCGAIIIGGFIGVFTAVFIVYFCPKKLKGVFEQLINLIAGIPSIIFGFFGMVVVVAAFNKISPSGNGSGLLASCIILGIMILPTVASLTKNALDAVPQSYFEGALALGNTREQAIFKIMLPAAKSGIIAGLVLGMGRAIGETMAVLMVAGGNQSNYPNGLFTSIRTLTMNIVMEMSYSTGLHKEALFATGFVLLVFVLLLNVALGFLKKSKRDSDKDKPMRLHGVAEEAVYECKGFGSKILKYVSISFACLVIVILLFLVGFILVKGLPYITGELLFGKSTNSNWTLKPALINTGMLVLLSLLIALPIGIGTAIYLVEYAKKGSKFVKVIRLFVDTLSGIPSIVFGLFGAILFCGILGLDLSLLAGVFTLVLMILPTIIRSTEESLMAVPDSMREGSLALGSGKVRTIFKIVLPSAISGIVTSIILSIGRIVGESAALIYTAGAVVTQGRQGYLSPGSSLAVMMWKFAGEGLYINQAYATAAILLILVAVLNLLVVLCEKKLRRGK